MKSVLLIFIILSVTLIVGMSFQSSTFATISLILLTGAMSRYFLPTHYTINKTGLTIVHIGITRQYPWSQYRRADCHSNGIFISPFISPHRLDTFRGQFLRTTNPHEIYHDIQHHIKNSTT